MVTIKKVGRPRPTAEDILRAISYGVLAVWGVVYALYPPISSVEALDVTLRFVWMSVTVIGAVIAFLGAVTRIDLKMELPGLMLGLLGPLFYSLTQLTFILFPTEASGPSSTRYALMVFTLLPVLFALPRIVSLIIESRRLKKINTESVETAHAIMQTLSTGSNPTVGSKK